MENSAESGICARISDASRKIEKHFCPVCGDAIYWLVDFDPDAVGILIGDFRDPLMFQPQVSYWTKTKHAWVTLPGDLKYLDTE